MGFKIVILGTDFLVYLLIVAMVAFTLVMKRSRQFCLAWRKVIYQPLGLIALIILLAYSTIGLLDCVHYRVALPGVINGKVHYTPQVKSVFDWLVAPLGEHQEITYSEPFSIYAYTKELVLLADGKPIRTYPRLRYAGQHLTTPAQVRQDIGQRVAVGAALGLVFGLFFSGLLIFYLARRHQFSFREMLQLVLHGNTKVPWRCAGITLIFLCLFVCILIRLAPHYYIFGTDKVGNDVFYITLKSIRTGLLIGTLTTLVVLPFAVLLGTVAGFFGRWIDDIIQYVYITLSSIPGVLLVVAAILSLQIYIDNHPQLFPTMAQRADVRLLALCVILGVASWTGLCRVLRAETLKLREIDYIQAATALGTPAFKIVLRHILPNVFHLILISVVLDFSSLVLAEAVLSYVGAGVDPTTYSWGNMIDGARLELAREPIVWWPLMAAFTFMFVFVLAANLFADAVRDAFDPRHG